MKHWIEMRKRALLIIDPQVDFITGSLPVPGAEDAMNRLAAFIRDRGADYVHVIVTADSHPFGHCSFREAGGEWPRHCVEGSVGAAVWPAVMDALGDLRSPVTLLRKGERRDREEYSIFANRDAAGKLLYIMADEGIDVMDVCGLAGDVCVASTLRDGIRLTGSESFNILTLFTPSIDGGGVLNSLIEKYGISCDR